MNIKLETWLSRLPMAEEQVGDGIVLSGRLMPGAAGEFRILAGQLCLSFLRADILEIEPVSVPTADGLLQPPVQPEVRVLLRQGAPIQDVRAAELCDQILPQRRPFALSVRPLTITLGPCTRFRDLEREFLLSQSLIEIETKTEP